MDKRAQEEIVGFAVIVVIVAIILVIILAFMLNKGTGKVTFQTSFQAESFIHSVLQYTSDCSDGLTYLPLQELTISCDNNEQCIDGRNACDVLNSTITSIISKSSSWNVGENSPVKGYELVLGTEEKSMVDIKAGNSTLDSRGSIQTFYRKGVNYQMTFKAYY